MKETIATILQSRMDKCTSEQFWAAGAFAGLAAFLISQHDMVEKNLSLWFVFLSVAIAALYSGYIIINRHYAYYALLKDLVHLLKDEINAPKSMKRAWKPFEGHGFSGVGLYIGVVIFATAGVGITYRSSLAASSHTTLCADSSRASAPALRDSGASHLNPRGSQPSTPLR